MKRKLSIVKINNDDFESKTDTLVQCQGRFGNLIKNLRGNLTQRELADNLSDYTPAGNSIKQTSIASYENAKALPSLDTFYAVVKYSGITADELLEIIFNGKNLKNVQTDLENDFNRIISVINLMPMDKVLNLGKQCFDRLYEGVSTIQFKEEIEDDDSKKKYYFVEVNESEFKKTSTLLSMSFKIQKTGIKDVVNITDSDVIDYITPYLDEHPSDTEKSIETPKNILDFIATQCFKVKYWLKSDEGFLPYIDDYSTKYNSYDDMKLSFSNEK